MLDQFSPAPMATVCQQQADEVACYRVAALNRDRNEGAWPLLVMEEAKALLDLREKADTDDNKFNTYLKQAAVARNKDDRAALLVFARDPAIWLPILRATDSRSLQHIYKRHRKVAGADEAAASDGSSGDETSDETGDQTAAPRTETPISSDRDQFIQEMAETLLTAINSIRADNPDVEPEWISEALVRVQEGLM